jgi:hypothetical protein
MWLRAPSSPPRPCSSAAPLPLPRPGVQAPLAGLPRRWHDRGLPPLPRRAPGRHRPRAVVAQRLQAAGGLLLIGEAAHRVGQGGARQGEPQQHQRPPATPHRALFPLMAGQPAHEEAPEEQQGEGDHEHLDGGSEQRLRDIPDECDQIHRPLLRGAYHHPDAMPPLFTTWRQRGDPVSPRGDQVHGLGSPAGRPGDRHQAFRLQPLQAGAQIALVVGQAFTRSM